MTRSIEDLLGRDAIAAVRRHIDDARGLPALAYTSEEFFRLEQETYFPRIWVAVAFTCDIPDPGYAMPVTVAGVLLILARNADGDINAYHNACRHRATTLITFENDFTPSSLASATLVIVFTLAVMLFVQRAVGLQALLRSGSSG